jgi:hypothetical protein
MYNNNCNHHHHHQQLNTSTEAILLLVTTFLCLCVGGLTIRNYETVPLMVISSSMSSLATIFALNPAVMREVTVTVVAMITAL